MVRDTLIELFDKDNPVIKMLQGKEGDEIAPEVMHTVEFLDKIEKEYGVSEKDIKKMKDSGVIDLLMKNKK